MTHFADRLIETARRKRSCVCVGLDPRLDMVPAAICEAAFAEHGASPRGAAEAILEFNRRVIDAAAPHACAFKPQIAFYELFGHEGVRAYAETIRYLHSLDQIVIGDIKRSDIGSTAAAYADAHLGTVRIGDETFAPFDTDAVTINAYLGSDGVKPFVEVADARGKGVFVLVRTSNPSAADLQDLKPSGEALYRHVARLVVDWGAGHIGESGYSSVGAVVGGTYPEEAAELRKLMPHALFLVPGYGAQGGTAADVAKSFSPDGLGAVVNSSRGIIFAFRGTGDETNWTAAVARAAEQMKNEINAALK